MTLPCYHSLLTPDRVYTALPPAHRRPNPKPSMQPYGHVTRPLPPNRSVGRTLWYSPIVHHKDSTACNFHLSNPVTGVYRSYTPGWGFLSWDLLDAAATRSSAVAALRGTAVPRCTSLCSGSLRVSVFFSFFFLSFFLFCPRLSVLHSIWQRGKSVPELAGSAIPCAECSLEGIKPPPPSPPSPREPKMRNERV